jgi:ABC-type phosphate transport system substrate-binding protein
MRALILALVVLAAAVSPARGDGVRVIVNAKNPVSRLDRQFIADAFLAKRTRWSDDQPIQPVDLGAKHPARGKFSSEVLKRTVDAVRRYWAQIVFSGRGAPPPELGSESEIVKYVAAHAGAIGYVGTGVELTGAKAVEVE